MKVTSYSDQHTEIRDTVEFQRYKKPTVSVAIQYGLHDYDMLYDLLSETPRKLITLSDNMDARAKLKLYKLNCSTGAAERATILRLRHCNCRASYNATVTTL